MKLKNAFKKYQKTVSIHKKSYETEKFKIKKICNSFLGDLDPEKITSIDIALYRDMRLGEINPKTGKPMSASTVRQELSLLSHFFEISRVEWGYSTKNPVKDVRKPKLPPGRNRRLSPQEKRKIFHFAENYSNPEFLVIITLALETAMRQGEILGLIWNHVDLKSRIIHLPETKNGEPRDVPLTSQAKEIFLLLKPKASGKVFTYSQNSIKSLWREITKTLKIDNLHFHDLRHEATSLLFEKHNLNVMEVASITGHKSLAMLKRYTHLKARKIVAKLDRNSKRSKVIVSGFFLPYPVFFTLYNGRFHSEIPDFLCCHVNTHVNIQPARAEVVELLTRLILLYITRRIDLPSPSEFSHSPKGEMVMISPLKFN
ncbi:MAG: site-specific integrase [Pseudomonadota bacterium]|nr:site-specific integrase [Pseudomonadota bacterium]